VLALSAGCASPRTGGTSPYAPQAEADRDGDKARRLNAEGAKLIDSDPKKAEALLRESLTADLFNGAAHNNLGVLYLKQGKLFEAAGEFEWARKLLPGMPDPRLNLALTLERAGRTDEALATYATALEVYPDHLPTLEALALLQVKSGKTDQRTRHMLEEIAMRGESERWRDWARGQMAKAREP
jgi:tetratricopeptide (TPR) repeat protein